MENVAQWVCQDTKQHNAHTVDMERFAGLNVYGFNFIEVFTEIFSHGLGQKCLLFSIIKERRLCS